MLTPMLYDDLDKTGNEGLFTFIEETGIWQSTEKNAIKRFIRSHVWKFLERQLIPEVIKRGNEIKDLTKDDKGLKKEYDYLMGVYSVPTKEGAEPKLIRKGLVHMLQTQLSSLHNDAPRTALLRGHFISARCGNVFFTPFNAKCRKFAKTG